MKALSMSFGFTGEVQIPIVAHSLLFIAFLSLLSTYAKSA